MSRLYTEKEAKRLRAAEEECYARLRKIHRERNMLVNVETLTGYPCKKCAAIFHLDLDVYPPHFPKSMTDEGNYHVDHCDCPQCFALNDAWAGWECVMDIFARITGPRPA